MPASLLLLLYGVLCTPYKAINHRLTLPPQPSSAAPHRDNSQSLHRWMLDGLTQKKRLGRVSQAVGNFLSAEYVLFSIGSPGDWWDDLDAACPGQLRRRISRRPRVLAPMRGRAICTRFFSWSWRPACNRRCSRTQYKNRPNN